MKHANMQWLVWKEYRQNRLVVFVMLFLLAVPYLIGLFVLWKWGIAVQRWDIPQWKACLALASAYSIGISQLAVALIGGNAIAGERLDRSAEFQAYMPLPRRKILSAKLLLVMAMVAVIWLPNAAILWGTSDALMSKHRPEDYTFASEAFGNIAIVGLTFFCVGWLFSSMIRSPSIAVCAGLIAPLMVYLGIAYIAYLREIKLDPLLEFWFPRICLALSPICFVIGTWLYLRRVEP